MVESFFTQSERGDMSGSGESSASDGRDEFGFDLASDDDEVKDLDADDEDDDFDDEDEDDDEIDGLLDEDELIDLDDEYDDTDEAGKPHPGHRYDD
jgi:hypothetical protein